jgi:phage tail sheath protein FI
LALGKKLPAHIHRTYIGKGGKMARTTYRAPGVYVEEIPSARQPIAGVGTSTAAFIGIVPDTLYYPVVNDNYDPVAAREGIERTSEATGPAGVPVETPDAMLDRLERVMD